MAIIAWLPSSFVNQRSVNQMSVDHMSVNQMSVNQMSVNQMSVCQMVFDQYDTEPKYPHIWFMFYAPFENIKGL